MRASINDGQGPMFDGPGFYRALDRERKRRAAAYDRGFNAPRSYSWLRVCREAGVGPPVLKGLQAGRAPTAHHLVRLLAWLGTYDLRPYVIWRGDGAPSGQAEVGVVSVTST